jgi:serine/threonine protein kinase
MASIRRVIPTSPANAVSTVPEGTVLALKIALTDDRLAAEAIAHEVETFVALSRSPGSPPCPRLYDIIGTPVTGLVMEWCPTDMERWWEAAWAAPRSFVELCEALADVSRRVREYEAVAEIELGKRVIHADIKPRNILRAVDGRWLLTDFGASKSRSVDDTSWAATRMILGTENFIAPEALFNARKPHPAAMDTFSLGCTFFALLRMRSLLATGGKMPPNGTHAHPFRSQRVALIGDLQQRKPALFVDKDLDPAAFPSPERLPDKDRRAVADSLAGVLGKPNPTLEGVLGTEVLNLLDRALRIDPALRFRDPLEMAGEFEALAQRFRELALRADGGTGPRRSGPLGNGAPAPAPEAMPAPPPDSDGAATGPRGRPPPAVEAPPTVEALPGGASAPRVLVSEEIVVEEGSGRKGASAAPSGANGAARVPPWIGVALLAVLGLQVIQVVVATAALLVALRAPPPVVLPQAAPTPGPLALATAPAPPAAVPAPALAALVGDPGAPVAEAPAAPAPVVSAVPVASAAPTGAGRDAIPAPAPAASPVTASPVTVTARDAPVDADAGGVVPKRIGTPPPAGTPAGGSGLLLVSGAQAYLIGPGGKMPVGSVAAGSYELFAQTHPNAEFESQGTVAVGNGERIVYKCGLGTCRRLP